MKDRIFDYLAKAGQQAPSADNSQPWFFSREGNNLKLFIDMEKLRPSCFDVNHPAILLAMGAVIENMMQAADWINIDANYKPCLDLYTGLCASFNVSETHSGILENAYDHPIFSRCTNRLPFDKRPLPEYLANEVASLSDSSCQALLFQGDEEMKQWAKWVCIASEIRFQTADVHEWFGQSLKFSQKEVDSNEGLDVNTLGLPLGGKSFLKLTQTWARMRLLNKVGAFKMIAKMESEKVADSPALIAFVGTLDDRSGIEVGRVMQRAWLKLNAEGLSVQPYFVITDQLYRYKQGMLEPKLMLDAKKLERDISLKPEFQDIFLYMLFRVGFSSKQPVRSKRKPIKFL